ncbi:MAG: thiamine pyrophosphate-dependent enzyme, partial [Planctomycetota bacterium]
MLFQNSGSGRTGISPANARYLDEMFTAWKADPDSVDAQWQAFFEGFELALGSSEQMAAGIGLKQSQVSALITAYRRLGHLAADLDPLTPGSKVELHEDLQLKEYGLTDADLDTKFDTADIPGRQRATLREIQQFLRDTYTHTVGVEFLHIHDERIRKWMIEQMERTRNRPTFDADRKRYILSNLVDAETFESFLHSRYPGQKRFSMEGAESIIPGLRAITDLAPLLGIEEIVFGMAHRGRLNVLVNIMHKSYPTIFSEFEENFIPGTVGGDADVKYHRGFRSIHPSRQRGEVRLTLCANPSHLEAVNPVVEGRTRGKQRQANDTAERKKIVPLLIHGDAAMAGQGLVAETLAMAGLEGYTTGGTVHVVINNQIGFTALPTESRSTRYCTDIAKIIEAPIFHVNGDDPEAVVYCSELALRFRQEFGKDIVIDMVCYRRHGHNEGDEPNFTQPEMYRKIRALAPTRQLYTNRLVAEGVLTADEGAQIVNDLQDRMQAALDDIRKRDMNTKLRYASAPPASKRPDAEPAWLELDEKFSDEPVPTAASQADLEKVAGVLSTIPDGLKINPKLARQITTRLETIKSNGQVDWAFAELLAFGTLLLDGTPVRLSGQDCERGTF